VTDDKAGAWVLVTDREDYLAMRDNPNSVDKPENYLKLDELLSLWEYHALTESKRRSLTIISDACYVPRMQSLLTALKQKGHPSAAQVQLLRLVGGDDKLMRMHVASGLRAAAAAV